MSQYLDVEVDKQHHNHYTYSEPVSSKWTSMRLGLSVIGGALALAILLFFFIHGHL